MLDKSLLEILVCPTCKGPLRYTHNPEELCCLAEKLAFPVRDDIPVMLADEARQLSLDELDALKAKK